jgi:hypothetical protein
MSELEDLYSAIEETARLVDVTVSRGKIWPILTAYDAARQNIIAFRVANDARDDGDFHCRFSLHDGVEPYGVALRNGLVARTEHPVGRLLGEMQDRCPIDSSGIDFGVVCGFRKIWVYFPDGDFQRLAKLADLPSMPASLADNVGLFARHGLDDRVDVAGINYHHRSVNLYFPQPPDPDTIRALHRDIGLPEPSERMLKFCEGAFGFYTTLSWDSPKVQRISFGAKAQDPMALPVRLGPKIEHFAKNIAYGVADPKLVYAAITSTGEEYFKLQSYYRWPSQGRRAGRGYPRSRSMN